MRKQETRALESDSRNFLIQARFLVKIDEILTL
jgi:hypothetical protein